MLGRSAAKTSFEQMLQGRATVIHAMTRDTIRHDRKERGVAASEFNTETFSTSIDPYGKATNQSSPVSRRSGGEFNPSFIDPSAARTSASTMQPSLPRRLFAEAVGTFLLVWFGCGAMMVDSAFGSLTHVGVAAAWGVVVAVLIYALGDVSGAHLNPAVSVGFAVAGRFAWKDATFYCVTQTASATLAAVALMTMVPEDNSHLGSTFSELGPGRLAVAEGFLTAVLMTVILRVSSGAKEKSITAGLAVGATIGLEALVFGPLTKASMNPARSFGPAIIDSLGHGMGPPMRQLPIYVLATCSGAIAGVFVHRWLDPSPPNPRNEPRSVEAAANEVHTTLIED